MSTSELSPVDTIELPTSPSPVNNIFIVAVHNNHRVALKRNPDYAATIMSIQKVFPTLAVLPPSSRICLSAQFEDFGDQVIEISEEIWEGLLPSLKTIQVSIVEGPCSEADEEVKQEEEAGQEEGVEQEEEVKHEETPVIPVTLVTGELCLPICTEPRPFVLHVRDTATNVETLALAVLPTHTIRQLKDMILEHDNRLPRLLTLAHQGVPILEDDKQLQDYGIGDDSAVTITTEFIVYITGRYTPKTPVTVATFMTVRFLKVLAFALMDENAKRRHPPHRQILTCAGKVLDDSRALGSYEQIIPECEIRINGGLRFAQYTRDNDLVTLRVHKKLPPNQVGDIDFSVMSGATVHDVKLLIYNTHKVPRHWQTLQDSSRARLYDMETLQLAGLKDPTEIYLVLSTRGLEEMRSQTPLAIGDGQGEGTQSVQDPELGPNVDNAQ